MFDLLKKHKANVQYIYDDYQIVTSYKRMSIEQAKNKSLYVIGSPKGLAASFAAGSVAGLPPSSHQRLLPLIKLFVF
ncbi:hypothetical protein [Thalassotalea sp. PP2-459]|uniref:hypothetical protein n=1 Tax=Thalassotalea sp. PP2-459 TaxID=1742724 RepID=UPI0009426A0E|nr:hypothetical protein [Thalassotalea sp. PP2-459]OKY25006.1 hypothetical protein BI291_17575 [Thalassotalea sp. PP2-459]